jgi:hypothetical protein
MTRNERNRYFALMGKLSIHKIELTEELWNGLQKVRRLAKRHDRLAEMDCNGEGYVRGKFYRCDGSVPSAYMPDGETTIFDAESEKVAAKITAICKPLRIKPEFQGDPRGYTVRLSMKSRDITDMLLS